ncbi:MAG: hypothetical protein IPH44_39305 [Myxococcales bacterium]|nr:hypothetical protein [Myxococcales bacterium]MBK7196406.1 hypothetical protein [Myxococcales bacterium]MBP6846673.1 hypothetical protein [Kofleriaceae bacterium]
MPHRACAVGLSLVCWIVAGCGGAATRPPPSPAHGDEAEPTAIAIEGVAEGSCGQVTRMIGDYRGVRVERPGPHGRACLLASSVVLVGDGDVWLVPRADRPGPRFHWREQEVTSAIEVVAPDVARWTSRMGGCVVRTFDAARGVLADAPCPSGAAPPACPRGGPAAGCGDRDGDGAIDAKDACPDQREDADGFADADGCPDLDDDDDGLPDAGDQCPREPEDADGFADADGCPDDDDDGDGLPDAEDRCPRAPETRNQRDDEDGCPDATRVDVRR